MATGKTTLGKALADAMGCHFADTDDLIAKKHQKSIPEIFELYGEEFFRQEETEMIKQLMSAENQVVATGGGAAAKEENMACLLENAHVICLTASLETIMERTGQDTSRPLLQSENRLNRIMILLNVREKHYAKADYHICTDVWDLEGFIKKIKEFINMDKRR